ncbi:zinc metallochaperone AztD [Actinophytocola glycyrrhizae]|uniref:Zinc metallochaperone AztD n=1 Tax=Actinophytocola glycyrrhizae TaxID=2044873 RepID=A0ABV9RV71_9PSEU
MRLFTLSTVALSAMVLGGCGTPASDAAEPREQVTDPVVATYDGGVYVMDGTTLETEADLTLSGFNRVNPAGNDRHVLVSTSSGFRVLDATGARLTDLEFAGEKPGHVVRHAGKTVLFADGTGEITVFDPERLGDRLPETEVHRTEEPHHGVALELANGELVVTLGTEEERTGMAVLDERRAEITRNEDCPGVHGEATAQGEAVVVGCENGVLVYRNGEITKITSPTPYGRIGNQSGTDGSPIVLGDYKQDPDAELERPEQVSLIDTTTGTMKLVDLGTSYTFRSLARGPAGEALVLGTDGNIHVLDPVAGTVTKTIPVTGPWTEPLEWQQPRPAIFVRGGTAYVSDPGTKQLHAVDLETGEKTATVTLPKAPNELSGVVAH